MAKKQAKTPEDIPENIFDALGLDTPDAVKDPKAEGEPNNPETTALDAITKNIAAIAERQGKQQDMILALMTPGQAVEQPSKAQVPEVSLDGLPDPSEDPAGYTKGLNERLSHDITTCVTEAVRIETQRAEGARAESQRIDNLFDTFQEQRYEALGKGLSDDVNLTDFVEVAAKRVVEKAQKRGLDVNSYMFKTQEQFFDDVAVEANKMLDPIRDKGDEGEAPNERPNPEKEEANRTAGLPGPGSGPAPSTNEEAAAGSLVKDIQDIQKATGFH